ncbi:MAG: DUF86 domain-containing protein [Anaerolineales bacterium]
MSPHPWKMRIEDILESIRRIQRYTSGLTFGSFKADQKTIDAVIRNLEIVGEAARHVPDEITDRHNQLPWEEMRGMRNVLIHEYFGVSIGILWHTITHNLPPLVEQLEGILEEESRKNRT